MDLAKEKCIALTTYRKNGEAVTTPVWINPVSDGRYGFWTSMGSGKTKRMTNNPSVTVQPCAYSGKVKDGTSPIAATAEMIQSGPLFDEVWAKGKKKYGAQVPMTRIMGRLMRQRKAGQAYGDTVVLLRLAD